MSALPRRAGFRGALHLPKQGDAQSALSAIDFGSPDLLSLTIHFVERVIVGCSVRCEASPFLLCFFFFFCKGDMCERRKVNVPGSRKTKTPGARKPLEICRHRSVATGLDCRTADPDVID